MTPARATAILDRANARSGTPVILRRIVNPGPSQTVMDLTVRATVRPTSAEEVVAGYAQTDSVVIISMTEITNAGGGLYVDGIEHSDGSLFSDGSGYWQSTIGFWPGLPAAGVGGDKAVILGTARQVEAVKPILIDKAVVRIELRVKG